MGTHAVQVLQKITAKAWVFDTDVAKIRVCVKEYNEIQVAHSLETACRSIDYILDATPAA
ncbi:MAG: hypothetical protein ACFFCW_30910 [Candidatus Hodarchaeota archaeon]